MLTGRTFLQTLSTALVQPDSRRFLRPWICSLFQRHTSLSDQVPWINLAAVEWLNSYVSPAMSVFEYGSGGSTLYFAKIVQRLVSVEHDADWHSRVSEALDLTRRNNYTLHLRRPERVQSTSGTTTHDCRSQRQEFRDFSFEGYVNTIGQYPDGAFDLVLIDGRARVACLKTAIPKVRNGGYIMLDNSERREYQDADALMTNHVRADFRGLVPGSREMGTTTIWRL